MAPWWTLPSSSRTAWGCPTSGPCARSWLTTSSASSRTAVSARALPGPASAHPPGPGLLLPRPRAPEPVGVVGKGPAGEGCGGSSAGCWAGWAPEQPGVALLRLCHASGHSDCYSCLGLDFFLSLPSNTPQGAAGLGRSLPSLRGCSCWNLSPGSQPGSRARLEACRKLSAQPWGSWSSLTPQRTGSSWASSMGQELGLGRSLSHSLAGWERTLELLQSKPLQPAGIAPARAGCS